MVGHDEQVGGALVPHFHAWPSEILLGKHLKCKKNNASIML